MSPQHVAKLGEGPSHNDQGEGHHHRGGGGGGKEGSSLGDRAVQGLTEFKDKVSEAIYDAFFKSFEECKKKVVQLFYLPDLHDIITDEPRDAAGKVDPSTSTDLVEAIEPEVDPSLPQETQVAMAATRPSQSSSVWETVAWVMAKIEAMINTTVEAIKSSKASALNSGL